MNVLHKWHPILFRNTEEEKNHRPIMEIIFHKVAPFFSSNFKTAPTK